LQSHLNDKSICNLKAAQLLHEHERYAAVPHCAYSACLQQIKYILCDKFQKYCDDDEIKGKNTHVVIWNEFSREINRWNEENQVFASEELVLVKLNFYLLKLYRIVCDYDHHKSCTHIISKESMDLAIQIMGIIQNVFDYGQLRSS
jgi:hypothetical protein